LGGYYHPECIPAALAAKTAAKEAARVEEEAAEAAKMAAKEAARIARMANDAAFAARQAELAKLSPEERREQILDNPMREALARANEPREPWYQGIVDKWD